jgi:abequosyltransferase
MNNIILSICIPTYNRASFLDRSLFYITSQISSVENLIEIIILDNDSSDDTLLIVKKYVEKGFPISYIKNDYNLGPDINVDKCYQIANGKYVLALGDDDIIVLNSLKKLINLIENTDYGVIHLASKPIESNIIYDFEKDSLNFKIYSNHDKFFEKIGYGITFISANIVNRKFYNNKLTSHYLGSSLPQVPFILISILKCNKNLLIQDIILRAQVDNTGGYNLLKVFGINLNKILSQISLEFPETRFYQIITNKLIIYFFPFWIIKLKKDLNFNKSEKANKLLKPLFYRNFRYWIYCYPLDFLSYRIAIIYNFIIHLPQKFNKILLKYFINK